MSTDTPFDFWIGTAAGGSLRVVSFTGRERLSRPFAFDLVVAGRDVDEARLPQEAVGQAARLTIHGPAGARMVRGVISRCASAGAHLHERTAWKLRLVPRLSMLRLRRNSRIFQDRSTPEIVTAILSEAKIAHRWDTARPYPARAYCVQYEETDLDFVQRLLAEVGVFYHFEHPGEDGPADAPEVLVFGDRAQYAPIDGDARLVHRVAPPGSGLALEEHHVTRLGSARAAAPAAYARRDYDFKRPLSPLEAAAKGAAAPGEGEVYEHHGEFSEAESEQLLEGVALEQLRRKASAARGESACPRLVPGRRFTLAQHELAGHDGDYLVTALEHEGHSPETVTDGGPTYQNRFSCVSAGAVLRPPRRPRQLCQVMETAVVTGPAGQEIHTDAHGRIKVQFHWDREGKKNERSSCWIRVAQAWSGTGWGFQFIPRIGMEVLVSFLGGDPDRPMVVGCVPNATHPPPYPLPENHTKSGIKTESTPGGGGFNEIMFNDAAGGEVIAIRAQRNFAETVLADHLQTVGNRQEIEVGGARKVRVIGSDELRVGGVLEQVVGGGASVSVAGSGQSIIGGSRSATIAGDDTTRVGGGHTMIVKGYSQVFVGSADSEGHGILYVNGNYRISAARSADVGAKDSLTLVCGESSLTLLPDQIKLKTPRLTLEAAEEVLVKAKDNEVTVGERIELKGQEVQLFGKDSSLILDDDGKLNGRLVKLNCDRPKPEMKEAAAGGEKGKITYRVQPHFPVQPGDTVVAVIATPDGKTVEREVPPDGAIELEGKPGDRFTLVELRKGQMPMGKAK